FHIQLQLSHLLLWLNVTCSLRSLDPFHCRRPGRCAVVVISRLNPVRFDGDDIPSCSVTDARLAMYPGRSSTSKVWNSPQSSTVSKLRPQTLQLERVSRSELNVDPAVVGLLSGDRQRRLGYVNAQNRQSQRCDVKSILAGPAARIEHRSGESAFGCQTHYCWLRLSNRSRRGDSVGLWGSRQG